MFLTVVFRCTVNAAVLLSHRKETVSHACYCHVIKQVSSPSMASRYVRPDGRWFCCSVEQFAICFSSQSWESYGTQKSFRYNVAFAPLCVPGTAVKLSIEL